jgi:hypothetical protein
MDDGELFCDNLMLHQRLQLRRPTRRGQPKGFLWFASSRVIFVPLRAFPLLSIKSTLRRSAMSCVKRRPEGGPA